jgi:hypothetical protein
VPVVITVMLLEIVLETDSEVSTSFPLISKQEAKLVVAIV